MIARIAMLLALIPGLRAESAPNIAAEMLRAHNAARAKVGVAPLRWSDELASYASEWASRLVELGAFDHRPNNRYGENLFMITGGTATPASVVSDWTEEARDYDYRSNTCRKICGHYTQVVWRGTTQVGCGVATRRKTQIWVCNYNPPGNWRGQRPY